MPLMFQGKIKGIKHKNFDNIKTTILQFIEDKPDGSFDTIQIKVTNDVPMTEFKKEQTVSVPVLLASMDNKIYYRIDAEVYKQQLARR